MRRALLVTLFLVAISPLLRVDAQTTTSGTQTASSGTQTVPDKDAKYFVKIITVPSPSANQKRKRCGGKPLSEQDLTIFEETSTDQEKDCYLFPQPSNHDASPSPPKKPIKPERVIALMGNPIPFKLEPLGKNSIVIYSSKPVSPGAPEIEKLACRIQDIVDAAPNEPAPPDNAKFSIELFVPHKDLFSNLESKASKLNPDFKVEAVGVGRLKISSDKRPSCDVWIAFITDLRNLAWKRLPESPVSKLYYLTADQAKAAIGGAATTPDAGAVPEKKAEPKETDTKKDAGTAPPKEAGATPGATTPDKAKDDEAKKDKDKPEETPPVTTVIPIVTDTLVFNESSPNSDSYVIDKKRILAQLDLPRPEMIVNAWVMQNSSKSPEVVSAFDTVVQRMAGSFNDGLEHAVFNGWQYLQERIEQKEKPFFDGEFSKYITYRYVGILPPGDGKDPAQEVLDLRSRDAMTPEQQAQDEAYREQHYICGVNEYCLGYNTLFHPLKPRLTDMLIAVVAAKNPIEEITNTIKRMEATDSPGCLGTQTSYCKAVKMEKPQNPMDCRQMDMYKLFSAAQEDTPPPLILKCFSSKAKGILGENSSDKSQLGLLRTAIADFLFNYKLSQQYPHEFTPYELSRSADTLNAAFAPFIEGFNADLKAYQDFLRADLKFRIDHLPGAGGWFPWSTKESFVNNAIVSVRTISGQATSLNTTSQSFLDTSSAPALADLAKAITGADTGELDSENNPKGILGNLPLNKAQFLLGALQSFQSSSAQIGRALTLNFTPRSLAAASASEITVTLNASDSAPPTYFSGPKAGNQADISRVAVHNTTTRIRIDSLKLFTVSSFSAELRKNRSQIPLLPLPFIEVPYIHTLAGIPLPSAKEYHTSTAIISAVVVPTAADLAFGLAFVNDRLRIQVGKTWSTERDWQMRRTISLRDFRDKPVVEFHRKKLACFTDDSDTVCKHLVFDDVPRDADERQK